MSPYNLQVLKMISLFLLSYILCMGLLLETTI